jgi:glycosyltransferase involved in cell wall biosynthesis
VLRADAPPNVCFTGFLNEADYQSLLASCDVLMALTRQPYTLLCGAYEAMSLGRPLVLSRHEDLAAYFARGRLLADNTPEAIAAAVEEALNRSEELAAQMRELREELRVVWDARFRELAVRIRTL